jgi:hypothetical protein
MAAIEFLVPFLRRMYLSAFAICSGVGYPRLGFVMFRLAFILVRMFLGADPALSSCSKIPS